MNSNFRLQSQVSNHLIIIQDQRWTVIIGRLTEYGIWIGCPNIQVTKKWGNLTLNLQHDNGY